MDYLGLYMLTKRLCKRAQGYIGLYPRSCPDSETRNPDSELEPLIRKLKPLIRKL